MSLDLNKKIEIQQQLIKELTAENDKLKEDLGYERTKNETKQDKYEELMADLMATKAQYESLIEDLKKQRTEFHKYCDMYKSLTEMK